jgi:hypothetical protein
MRRTLGPIILNYMGEIVKLKENKSRPFGELVLPPLGRATVTTEEVKLPNDIFPTIHYTVRGLPPAMHDVVYIVSDNVAKNLSRHRNDLLILCNVSVKMTKNPIKAGEIMLECEDFAHVLVEISEN